MLCIVGKFVNPLIYLIAYIIYHGRIKHDLYHYINLCNRVTLSLNLLRVREYINLYSMQMNEMKQQCHTGKKKDGCDISTEEANESLARCASQLEYWRDAERSLVSYLHVLSELSENSPFFILGFPASYATTITICSSLLSFYLTLISAYLAI